MDIEFSSIFVLTLLKEKLRFLSYKLLVLLWLNYF